MTKCKNKYSALLILIVFLLYWHNVLAQSIGYNQIFLGSRYNTVKNILLYHDCNFKEMKIGVIRIITYDDSQSHGMLVFDFFDRLYTIIITLTVTDLEFDQLLQHLKHKYGEFIVTDTSLYCTIGTYRVYLYRNKTANTATVEYGHTIPLFYPKVEAKENPFSKF